MRSILTLDNSTLALKARRLLARNGIDTVLTRISGESSGGCTYALEIDTDRFFDAVFLLKAAEINYRVFK